MCRPGCYTLVGRTGVTRRVGACAAVCGGDGFAMLTLLGPKHRYCDGVARRSFLKIGGLAMGGLGLPQLLQAEARAGAAGSHKAVIMVYLSGGLAHQDTFD